MHLRLLTACFLHKLIFVNVVDFRSDTVTWPTAEMRRAMANAEVGDDVYGEDPTIRELEQLASAMVGKDAGLFVSSGTMGNLVGILAHATRGEGAIVGLDAHVFVSEAGGMSALAGVVPQPLETDSHGRMDLTDIQRTISPDDPHYARTRLILVENSYRAKNGYPIEASYFSDIRKIANGANLKVHMDGARLFNAATALGVQAEEITRFVDSISFCLSKGLGSPVGSVVCGTNEFIEEARRARKILGGATRQGGIIAAAGIVALKNMVGRLGEDHANARTLAEGIAEIRGLLVNLDDIKTNIVFFDLDESVPSTANEIAEQIYLQDGILLGVENERSFRAVTHYWIDSSHVNALLSSLKRIIEDRRQSWRI